MSVRVRFAPSPTGSLHLGNALAAAANASFARDNDGAFVLRVDDTDPARNVEDGEEAILDDLRWLGIAWDEGPYRQSERGDLYAAAAARALETGGAVRDEDGSIRLGRTTLVRPDGTPTYPLATVVDDVELGITHILRGSDHRPNEHVQRRIAAAIGAELPDVRYLGLLLGEDGKKLSKRHGHAAVADLRAEGIPGEAVRAYLDELGLPAHDVRLDMPRIRRLAIDAIAAMTDEELARAAGAPAEIARALRGARTLVEAREIAAQILSPADVELPAGAEPTLTRFLELRAGAGLMDETGARAIVRELKAVGGDLRALRKALTGADSGPELWAVVQALSYEETRRRIASSLPPDAL
jgi:hypothetical protein